MEKRGKWTIVKDYLSLRYTDTLLFIFLVNIAVSAISSLFLAISSGGIISNIFLSSIFVIENGTIEVEAFNPALFSLLIPAIIFIIIISIALSMLDQVIKQGLNIELLNAIKDERTMQFKNLINLVKDNFIKFSIITLQIVLINFILAIGLVLLAVALLFMAAIIVADESFIIVLVASLTIAFLIISIIVNTRLTYSYITANDNPKLSSFEAIKLAYRESKGHTLAIFSISLKYILIAIAPALIILLLLAITLDAIVSVPLLVVTLIFQMIFPLLLMPHYLSYKIVYYDRELKVKDLL